LAAPDFSAVALCAISMMPVSSLGSLAGIPMQCLPSFPAKFPALKLCERGKDTFQAVHVEAARRIAGLARQAGAETLVHISGIGANAGSASLYVRSRGEGEAAVLDAFPSAKLVRPAVMFGPGDAFLTALLAMLRRLPIFPMFGSGATRLQPVYVEDVAEAVVRILRAPAASQPYELAGPCVYTYQELLRTIAASAGTRPLLVPFPFSLWHVIGYVAEALPSPPLTRNQVELMGQDNISEPGAPGFEALQISPYSIEIMLSGDVAVGTSDRSRRSV